MPTALVIEKMKLSNKQKMLLHTVPAGLGITEAERRIIQRNVGGFFSAADKTCTRAGFVAVMAFYESRAPGRCLPGGTPDWWAAEAEKTPGPNDSLIRKVRAEAFKLGWTEQQIMPFLCGKHMSNTAYQSINDAPRYWLIRLLEAIKAIRKREGSTVDKTGVMV